MSNSAQRRYDDAERPKLSLSRSRATPPTRIFRNAYIHPPSILRSFLPLPENLSAVASERAPAKYGAIIKIDWRARCVMYSFLYTLLPPARSEPSASYRPFLLYYHDGERLLHVRARIDARVVCERAFVRAFVKRKSFFHGKV